MAGFGRSVRRAVVLVGALALAGVGAVALSSPAGATTVNDETSFRNAWTDPGETQIDLAADITLSCGGGGVSVRNSSTALTLNGNGHTITQTCANNAALSQDGTGAVSLSNVTITGGHASGGGSIGDNGGAIGSAGDITLTNATITGNKAEEDGGGVYSDTAVKVQNSTITNNQAGGTGGGGGISALGPVTVSGSTIAANDATATPKGDGGGGIATDDAVNLTSSSVHDNTSRTEGGGIEAAGAVTLTRSTVANNQAAIDAGGADTEAAATITKSTISGNIAGQDAGGLETCGDAKFTNSTLTNNTAQGEGGGLNVPSDCTATVTLVYATIVSNTAHGVPERPEAEAASAADAREEAASPVGAQAVTGTANIGADGHTLVSFGSVVALPQGGGPNCRESSTTSNGFNFSDDASCGFTNTAQGDVQNGGDPGLGALANNGGPTQTRLPQPGSPLIDAIPVASCQADGASGITDDQRGVSRPQGAGCDIGAVEVKVAAGAAPVVAVVPRFTG